ncbi:MAG: FAD-binding oxidoreductase [Candidatus Acidiferrales bacterium]
MAAKTAPSRLADIVGAPNVSNDPAQIRDFAVDGKIPGAAVRPGTPAEVAEIVKFAAAENLAVVATSARTKLGLGLPPRKYDLAIDMSRLDRVVAFDPGDLTLGVEPGILLSKLATVLAEHKQFLPLAVPYSNRASAGGTIASGVDNPLRQYYGTARDYLLGVEYVTGEGVAVKSGGRVVKNVTGYDLHKLMIGSLGTLGIMTRINFRTYPKPEAIRGFVASFDRAEQAVALRHRIAQSALTPLTLEILSPRVAEIFAGEAAARVESNVPRPQMLSSKHWTLAASYAGNDKVLERYATELRGMAGRAGAVVDAVLGDDQRPSVWGRLREFIPIALESSPATTIMKIGVLPMRMKEMLESAARIAESNSLPWAAVARGLGIIYVALLPNEKNEDTQRRVRQASDQILAACGTLEANATIPWCPSEWKGAVKVWGNERADFAQMAKLKKIFDPPGILSPGRFIGGL